MRRNFRSIMLVIVIVAVMLVMVQVTVGLAALLTFATTLEAVAGRPSTDRNRGTRRR